MSSSPPNMSRMRILNSGANREIGGLDDSDPFTENLLEDKKSVIKQDSLFGEDDSFLIQATQVADKIESEVTNTKESYS